MTRTLADEADFFFSRVGSPVVLPIPSRARPCRSGAAQRTLDGPRREHAQTCGARRVYPLHRMATHGNAARVEDVQTLELVRLLAALWRAKRASACVWPFAFDFKGSPQRGRTGAGTDARERAAQREPRACDRVG